MSRDEGSLPKSELGLEVRKCASCGAEGDAADVYCAECGAELPLVASSVSAPATTETPSEQTITALAALAPRDALRGLFAGFPGVLTDRAMFLATTDKLFANDGQRRARYLSVQSTGILAGLQGKLSVSVAEWEVIISDLVKACGFSRAVAVEIAEEWSYALNVKHPSSKPVADSGPSQASEGGAKTAGQGSKFIGASIVLLVCLVCWVVFGGRATPTDVAFDVDQPVAGDNATISCAASPVVADVEQHVAGDNVTMNDSATPVATDVKQHVVADVYTLVLPGNVAMDFVWCPPGTFTMGSPESELGRYDDEVQHRVTLTNGFWIAKYPTTQRQYKALIGGNSSMFKGDDHPVEQVSWDAAVAFCEKVNEHLGFTLPDGFRCALPTEAQWEYACRAGTTSAFNSGDELTTEDGNCPNLNAVAWYGESIGGETHAVGQKQANAWGLYDMHGNVYELCRDWYDAYPTGSVTDPTGPESGSDRVSRGGSWGGNARCCRSAYRYYGGPSFRCCYLGFRPVLAL